MNKQRLLMVTLVVSLLANAFFIGFAATRFIDDPADGERSGILRSVGARLTKNLDDASRERVAVEIDLLLPHHRETMEMRRENYQKLRQLLSEPVVDRAAVDTVTIEMKSQSSDLVFRVHEKAIDAILALPADTRARIADAQ